MDGHVSQASHWSEHIKAWCRDNKRPYPSVVFKSYNVDDLATNVQMEWDALKISFEEGFSNTEEGQEFFRQIYAFQSKKMKRKDDAPDALTCAHQFITERKFVRRRSAQSTEVFVTGDFYESL
jgi:hypothetical protein